MTDLISRQAAIEAIRQVTIHSEDESLAVEALEILPSAQPERKKGKWLHKSKPLEFCTVWWYECSECGSKPPLNDRYGHTAYLSDYCPNCGADMRGENDVGDKE